jgi:DNA polymerase zeta
VFYTPTSQEARRDRNSDDLTISTHPNHPSNGHHKPINQPLSSQLSMKSLQTTGVCFEYALKAPSSAELQASVDPLAPRENLYKDPYYSNPSDIPEQGREFGGLYFELNGGNGVDSLPEWGVSEEDQAPFQSSQLSAKQREDTSAIATSALYSSGISSWEYAEAPPGRKEILRWIKKVKHEDLLERKRLAKQSQV